LGVTAEKSDGLRVTPPPTAPGVPSRDQHEWPVWRE
jgi:hypothetical protein